MKTQAQTQTQTQAESERLTMMGVLLAREIARFRGLVHEYWKTPTAIDSLRYLAQEANEARDARMRARTDHARNTDRGNSAERIVAELADTVLMALTHASSSVLEILRGNGSIAFANGLRLDRACSAQHFVETVLRTGSAVELDEALDLLCSLSETAVARQSHEAEGEARTISTAVAVLAAALIERLNGNVLKAVHERLARIYYRHMPVPWQHSTHYMQDALRWPAEWDLAVQHPEQVVRTLRTNRGSFA